MYDEIIVRSSDTIGSLDGLEVAPVIAPVREEVLRKLREAIVTQRLRPGARLVERELCELTRTSRTSVREALRQLESEGLVRSSPRGVSVARVSAAEAASLYEARSALEGAAAALCAQRADAQQLQDLQQAFAGLQAAGEDTQAALAAKDRFYAAMFDGARSPVIAEMLGSIHARVSVLRAASMTRLGRPAEAVRELGEIVEAIAQKDPAAASVAARRHIENAAAALEAEQANAAIDGGLEI